MNSLNANSLRLAVPLEPLGCDEKSIDIVRGTSCASTIDRASRQDVRCTVVHRLAHCFHFLAVFAFVAVAFAWETAGLAFADWPLVRGDSQGTGVAKGKLPAIPKVLWEYKTGVENAGFEGTPTVIDGKVIIGDFKDTIHAIDMKTGKAIWKVQEKDGFLSSASCTKNVFVIGDFSGNVFAYKISDGSRLWSVEIDSPVTNGGNLIGSEVLLSSDSGSLFAMDLETGKQRWSFQTGDQLRSTACVWNNQAFLGGCDSRLHRVDLEKGTAEGDGFDLGAPTLSTPNLIDNIAIVPTNQGTVYAIRLDTKATLWSYTPDVSLNVDIRSSSATQATVEDGKLKGIVVVASRNKRLLGIDASNGKLKWEAVLKKRADASPVICDGRAWIGGADGMVYAIDLETGKETWSYQLAGQILASPAISDNRLIIATEKGSVVCFGE